MQDSNNINLFNNYSFIYTSNNQLDKDYNSNQIKNISYDREDELFLNEGNYEVLSKGQRLIFQYHKTSYDAFNSDRNHIVFTNKGRFFIFN
jgi:hypothetical protein